MSAAGKIIHRYFHQLIHGCGNTQCSNMYCRSSSLFKYIKTIADDRNEVAAEAIRLSLEHVPLCVDENIIKEHEEKLKINNLTENNLQELINYCKKMNNWNLLNKSLEDIFSKRLNLLNNFLKEDFSNNILMNAEFLSTASATPKSFFVHDPRITLDNDEITLDIDVMKRSIKLLSSYEDHLSLTIHKSLDSLLNQLQYELKSKQHELETDANFFNLFFIIFELPYLSDPSFLFDIARLFYSILTNLSIDAQAKFVRIVSKHTNNLNDYISHVQQYITLHTLRWCNHVQITSDNDELLSSEPGDELFKVDTCLFFSFKNSYKPCDH
ncbi:unnamed protein product [Rotaria sp. Silwood2]|nr:unnamed protein product [Rotaria sp. Silwood2]CAF2512804.1 unnamed protein product [Rotaria sp. Silwood2]CAF2721837.1 unnamed protein product [Rotaria sp. Silwood2]CAF2874589.1 unnamed protein product [Rotaria sp. Silwood2]